MYQLLQFLVIAATPTHNWYLKFPSRPRALSILLPNHRKSILIYRIHVIFKENVLLTVRCMVFLAFELAELSWGFTRFLWCTFLNLCQCSWVVYTSHPLLFSKACSLHGVILHSVMTLRNRYVESQQDPASRGLPPRDQEEMGTKRSQSKSELVLNLGNASRCFLS